MIFITTGTQEFQFDRLFNSVINAIESGVITQKVVAQTGYTKVDSELIECHPFLPKEKFNTYIDEADFIISHAGTGSVISALKKEKKVIVATRLAEFNEHIDDHQLELLKVFSDKNLIIPLKNDFSDLKEKIQQIDQVKLEKFKSNTTAFNKNLIDLISEH